MSRFALALLGLILWGNTALGADPKPDPRTSITPAAFAASAQRFRALGDGIPSTDEPPDRAAQAPFFPVRGPDHRGSTFLSTSVFMLANLLPLPDPPQFAQLNFGVRVTPKDTLIVQAITWQYHAPLGVPYGPRYGQTSFPGSVRDYGVGLGYQRYLWRGLFVMVDATPFLQVYNDASGHRIQKGFQLFTTGRVGYRFDLLSKRLFVEPSMACTAWPINTNLPPAFQALEDQYPDYFLLEPGLNLGIAF